MDQLVVAISRNTLATSSSNKLASSNALAKWTMDAFKWFTDQTGAMHQVWLSWPLPGQMMMPLPLTRLPPLMSIAWLLQAERMLKPLPLDAPWAGTTFHFSLMVLLGWLMWRLVPWVALEWSGISRVPPLLALTMEKLPWLSGRKVHSWLLPPWNCHRISWFRFLGSPLESKLNEGFCALTILYLWFGTGLKNSSELFRFAPTIPPIPPNPPRLPNPTLLLIWVPLLQGVCAGAPHPFCPWFPCWPQPC